MKSIKEKAEAYDKVLEWATEAHKVCDGMLKEDLEHLFPELKESEGDRIKKKIIATIHLYYGEPLEEEAKEMIAWVEKQGEQNQETNYPKFDFDDILAIQYCMETAKKVTEDKELYEKLQSLHDRLHDAYWIGKQGEQKPSWSEEDERTYKSITYSFANNYPLTVQQQEFVKSLKERYTWKPSDEQIEALADALSLAKNCGEEYAFDLRTLLDDLKRLLKI